MLFKIFSKALLANPGDLGFQGGGICHGVFGVGMKANICEQFAKLFIIKAGYRGLAHACTIDRRSIANLRIHTHRLTAFQFVEVDDFLAAQDAEMHGLTRCLMQRLHVRLCQLAHSVPRPGTRGKFQQAQSGPIGSIRRHIHQTFGHEMFELAVQTAFGLARYAKQIAEAWGFRSRGDEIQQVDCFAEGACVVAR